MLYQLWFQESLPETMPASLFGNADDIEFDIQMGGGIGDNDDDACLTGDHEDGTKENFYPTPPSRDEYPDINRVLESTCKAAIMYAMWLLDMYLQLLLLSR